MPRRCAQSRPRRLQLPLHYQFERIHPVSVRIRPLHGDTPLNTGHLWSDYGYSNYLDMELPKIANRYQSTSPINRGFIRFTTDFHRQLFGYDFRTPWQQLNN